MGNSASNQDLPRQHQIIHVPKRDMNADEQDALSKNGDFLNLVENVAAGSCILYVGAGLSHNADRLPLWDEMVLTIARDFGDIDKYPPEIFKTYKLEYLDDVNRRDSLRLTRVLKKLFDRNRRRVPILHKDLSKLPWAAVITTNYDDLIESAYNELRKDYFLIEADREIPLLGLKKATPIVKMHGSLDANADRVLAASEYVRFDQERAPMKAFILSLILQYPILFLGAGLSDPNMIKLFGQRAALREARHPCFYLSTDTPGFVRSYWNDHKFRFLPVGHHDYSQFITLLKRDVDAIRARKPEARGVTISSRWHYHVALKQLSLRDEGDGLRYESLQRKYLDYIHIPDYGQFTKDWERSLYGPLRANVAETLKFPHLSGTFGYVGPGINVPLFRDGIQNEEFQHHMEGIVLVDVSVEVLGEATRSMAQCWDGPNVSALAFDITGGLGSAWTKFLDNLCELPVDQLLASIQNASEPSNVYAWDGGTVSKVPFKDDLAVIYSEMVASFTGTPSLMAFETTLKTRAESDESVRGSVPEILKAVRKLWQRYNDVAYRTQIALMAEMVRPDGIIVVALDTEKRFDDRAKDSVFSFSDKRWLVNQLPEGVFLEEPRFSEFWWRDHPYGIPVGVAGFDDDYFLGHEHRIEFVIYRKRSVFRA